MPIAFRAINSNLSSTVPLPHPAVYSVTKVSEFTYPYFGTMRGIAIHPSTGNIYITNSNATHDVILIFTKTGTWISQIGSTNGAGDNQFDTPIGIAVNSSGYVFVADSANSCFKVYNSSGAFKFKTGTSGAGTGQFRTPTGITVNGTGYIIVSDTGQGATKARLQAFSPAGIVYGTPLMTDQNTATGLAKDGSNNLYLVRTARHDVKVFSSSWTALSTIGTGVQGNTNDQFNTPNGVGIDAITGRVYVADTANDRVQVFDNAGTYLTTISGVTAPSAVAVDSSGQVYVVDDGNNKIQIFSITTSTGGGGESDGGQGNGETPIPTDFMAGFLITEYIVFGALFGGFAVIEIVIPKLKKRREVPTRLKPVEKTPDKKTTR